MHPKKARHASKSSDSPPTQNTSFPRAAWPFEPVTGASRKRMWSARDCFAISLDNDGLTVLQPSHQGLRLFSCSIVNHQGVAGFLQVNRHAATHYAQTNEANFHFYSVRGLK